MYPMMRDGVSIGTYTIEGEDPDILHYYASNSNDEEFDISEFEANELCCADGTKPINLNRRTIAKLEKQGLLQTTRFIKDDGYNRFLLFPLGERMRKYRDLCILLNNFFPAMALVVFAFACLIKLENGFYTGDDFNALIYYGLLLFSVFAHEIGHMVAGIAYGYPLSELGVLLWGIFPVGAYVAHSEKSGLLKSERIQFCLAGVELNLLLAGVFLLMSMEYYSLSATFIAAANLNVALAVFNILPAKSLDGESALSVAIGVDSINNLAWKCLRKRKVRKQLMKSGLKGYVYLGLFGFSIISDAANWLVLGYNIIILIISMFV